MRLERQSMLAARPGEKVKFLGGELRLKIRTLGDAVFLPLSRMRHVDPTLYTLIDASDYDRVIGTTWSPRRNQFGWYVRAGSLRYLAAHHRLLHAFIMRVKPGEMIDHISGDTLDNRKQNLRVVTHAQNSQNMRRPTFPGKTSRFKGVCWSQYEGKWHASIRADGMRHDLGMFNDETAAALAYDAAASELHGEYARTNAVMHLFEQLDPFVPSCANASRADGRIEHASLTTKRARGTRRSYRERIDDKARALIFEYERSA